MKKLFSNIYIRYSLLIISGIFIGWLIFYHSHQSTVNSPQQLTNNEQRTTNNEIWTCAMHPQIRMHHPGKCPICGMNLIPLTTNNKQQTTNNEVAVHLTREAAELANVETSLVSKQQPVKHIRLYGKVQTDERLVQNQIAQVSGRIEKLLVNFTGEQVKNGQLLAVIYSPELVTAQQELLEAEKMKQTQPQIFEAAREKLKLWKLTEEQINEIERTKLVKPEFDIFSNTSGVVMRQRVLTGDYVSQGMVLFEVADLSKVWVLFDVYESDLPFIKTGDKISFTSQAIPEKNYLGVINFIDPVVDPYTRVAKARMEIDNPHEKLKPEIFVTGSLDAKLGEYGKDLVIPASAVLWTGKRSIVYVKLNSSNNEQRTTNNEYVMREIELGAMLNNSYVVLSGLKEGEEIVTQGTFSVDAAAQLEGKPNMMNRQTTEKNEMTTMPGM